MCFTLIVEPQNFIIWEHAIRLENYTMEEQAIVAHEVRNRCKYCFGRGNTCSNILHIQVVLLPYVKSFTHTPSDYRDTPTEPCENGKHKTCSKTHSELSLSHVKLNLWTRSSAWAACLVPLWGSCVPSLSAPASPRMTVTGLAELVQNWWRGG